MWTIKCKMVKKVHLLIGCWEIWKRKIYKIAENCTFKLINSIIFFCETVVNILVKTLLKPLLPFTILNRNFYFKSRNFYLRCVKLMCEFNITVKNVWCAILLFYSFLVLKRLFFWLHQDPFSVKFKIMMTKKYCLLMYFL